MTRFLLAASFLALGACATEAPAVDDAPVSVERSALTLEQSPELAVGQYDDGKVLVEFRSEMPTATDLDIEMVFNDMMVTVTVDYVTGLIDYDGFALEDGSPTQFTDADRKVIFTLNRALEQLGTDVDHPVSQLRKFTATWAEFPSTVDPKGHTFMDKDRSYTSICWAENSYQSATHDGWWHDRWDDDATTDYAYVSRHASGPCNDGTYFWNGSWSCYEPDHDSGIEYGYGGCFGRCGSECGSDAQFTWDCLDHDQCVRTGHSVASLWCDDEFISTTDDWALAPNC